MSEPTRKKGRKKKAPAAAPSSSPSPPPRPELPAAASASAATKISASVGIVAAMVLAVLVNVFVARHYRRWDWTRGGLYTLSDATIATLRSIEEPVKVHVLLPGGDPLTLSVQRLLEEYRGHTSRIEVELVDPDRRPAEFLALAQRYGIGADSEQGRIVASAALVVARGDRHEIVRPQELVEVDAEDDLRRRPRIEQALTGALRAVQAAERPRACFTAGHGEIQNPVLRERLVRSGYEVADVEPAKEGGGPIDGCKVLVIAAPAEKVPAEDVARFRAYVEKGGSALVALGQRPGAERQRDFGLGDLLATAGVRLADDVVFELDPKLRTVQGRGETFAPTPKTHPATRPLARGAERGLAAIVTMAHSLDATGAGSAAVAPLLVTSEQAFGMTDFFGRSESGAPPLPGPGDRRGPLTIATASELPKPPGSTAPHGGRVVVVGSAGVLMPHNWQSEDLRGTALFVDGAIDWLTARAPILDIPVKPAFTAGLRVSDEWVASTFRYVVLYMPLAAMLLGVAVHLRRRSTEERRDKAG